MSNWINVYDKLPKLNKPLWFLDKREVYSGCLGITDNGFNFYKDFDEGLCDNIHTITHWRYKAPQPKPPKES